MRKMIISCVAILLLYGLLSNMTASAKMIPDEAIRLRVIPNSNSEYDQAIKGKVKDSLQGSMYELLKDTKGVEDARSVIISHLPLIDERIENVLKEEGYTAGYTLDYGYHYFPEKQFEGISYEEGEYESLLVTLGEGKGDNWWWVLFPPLCLIEAEESDTVEYKFFLQELMEKYL